MGTRTALRITGTLAAPISQASRVRSYESGRICSHSECDTVLSVYNPTKFCTIHAKFAVSRRRGAPRPVAEVVCAHCGSEFETTNPARRFCSDRCRMAAFARRKRAAVRAENRQQEAQALQAMATVTEECEAVVDAA